YLDAKSRTLSPSFHHLLTDMAAGCRLALYARNIAPLVQRGRGSCRFALRRTAAAMCALDLMPDADSVRYPRAPDRRRLGDLSTATAASRAACATPHRLHSHRRGAGPHDG